MTKLERIEKLMAPEKPLPSLPVRVSAIETLMAEVVLLVKKISVKVDNLDGGKPK